MFFSIIFALIGLGFLFSFLFAFLLSFLFFIPAFLFLAIGAFFLFYVRKQKKNLKEASPAQDLLLEKRMVTENIRNITLFLKNLVKHNHIDLTKRIETTEPSLITFEDYFNFLLNSLAELIEWMVDKTEKLSIFSSEINYYSGAAQKKSESQILYAGEIIKLVQQLLDSFKIIVAKGQEAFSITDESNEIYQKGNEIMNRTIDSVREIAGHIQYTISYMENLKKFTLEIESVIKTIVDMSHKTNMLALNASIEAVRAGESGKGFKVVANEIQKFSIKTSDAAKKITASLKELNAEMSKSFQLVETSSQSIENAISETNSLKDYFARLSGYIGKSLDSTKKINEVASHELSEVETINEKINNIQTAISDFQDDFMLLSKTAKYIAKSSEEIGMTVSFFEMNNYQSAAKKIMGESLEKITGLFNQAIAENKITLNDLFDSNYQLVADTKPQKYRTLYDALFEKELQEILEKMNAQLNQKALEFDKKFLSCGIMDKNGYIPAALKEFSKPLTGNYENDMVFSLVKQVLKDPVTMKALSNKQDFLIQVYMNNDGTQNANLSMPIKISDKLWGCLKAEYVLRGFF